MEMEIEDLHIQMEDVVKSKLSVSLDIPDAENLSSTVSTTTPSSIARLCGLVFNKNNIKMFN